VVTHEFLVARDVRTAGAETATTSASKIRLYEPVDGFAFVAAVEHAHVNSEVKISDCLVADNDLRWPSNPLARAGQRGVALDVAVVDLFVSRMFHQVNMEGKRHGGSRCSNAVQHRLVHLAGH
jgi:hypothetical protein